MFPESIPEIEKKCQFDLAYFLKKYFVDFQVITKRVFL